MSSLKQDTYIFPETEQFWRPRPEEVLAIFDVMTEDLLVEGVELPKKSSLVSYKSRTNRFFDHHPPTSALPSECCPPSIFNAEAQREVIELTNEYFYEFFDYSLTWSNFSASSVNICTRDQLLETIKQDQSQNPFGYEIFTWFKPDAMIEFFSELAGEPRYPECMSILNMDLLLDFNNGGRLGLEFADDLILHLSNFAILIDIPYWSCDDEDLFDGYLIEKIKQIEAITQKKFTIKSCKYLD